MELKEVMNVMQVSGERIPSGYYKKPEVDAVLAELKDHNVQLLSENMELKQKLHDAERKADLAEWANTEYRKGVDKLKAENEILKGREEVQDDYRGHWLSLKGDCDKLKAENERLRNEVWEADERAIDAGATSVEKMEELRTTRRALWLARAKRAKEHVWHDVKKDGSPKEDYKGRDWVLVQLREIGGIELIPRIAEYRQNLKRWAFIDEDYDTENSHEFRYLRDKCVVIGWRDIDFAYYGKKFFVQQEISKNVERKCLKKASFYL